MEETKYDLPVHEWTRTHTPVLWKHVTGYVLEGGRYKFILMVLIGQRVLGMPPYCAKRALWCFDCVHSGPVFVYLRVFFILYV